MAKYIDKEALVEKIESKFQKYWKRGEESDSLQDDNAKYWGGVLSCLNEVKTLIDTLEVKENKLPNPRFPHLDNIVDKVFGAGNLESWEYEEAKQLVLLAKEELLKDLEVKDADLEKVFNDEYSKFSNDIDAMDYAFPIDLADYKDFAKHFFEFGLKAI